MYRSQYYGHYKTVDTPISQIKVIEPVMKPIQINNTTIVNENTQRKQGVDKWGPHYWYVIHKTMLHYPENPTDQDLNGIINFIKSIPNILPCSICSDHAEEYLNNNQMKLKKALGNNHLLFMFFVDFHNDVNKRQGKPVMPYEKAFSYWSNA